MFDTHCHLNFKAFDDRIDEVINRANRSGVDSIIIPGTDVEMSEKAVKIAEKNQGIYAAVGIHPHHVFEFINAQISVFSTASPQRGPRRLSQKQKSSLFLNQELKKIKNLLNNKKVIAVGEVGIDRHIYQKTKYPDYKVEEEFISIQKIFLKEQIGLAIKHDKSLILHSREAREDTLGVLREIWDKKLEGRTVFHCCEPDKILLKFAQEHKVFIGVDGDIFYKKDKQEFIKTTPLEMLVLETDSPFLSPDKKSLNEPKNILLIAGFIAKLKNISIEKITKVTTENARRLFKLQIETLS
jgi:TatD DNase family protein